MIDVQDISCGVREGIKQAHEATLLDQFAMAALNGNMRVFFDNDVTDYEDIASDCYLLAEKMMKQRAKRND